MEGARPGDEAVLFRARVEAIRRRHRPKLSDWRKDGFASRRRGEFLALGPDTTTAQDIARVEACALTPERFEREFASRQEPVLVAGVPAAENWRGAAEWSLDAFEASPTYRGLRMKCGEDDAGKTLRLSLGDFARYARADCDGDDSPLYVFDSGFADSKTRRDAILRGFAPPRFLSASPRARRDEDAGDDENVARRRVDADLFELVGERRRPPYRWLLVGPARSGTCAHVDPLGTAAWNTVLSGRKLWVLFEPGTAKHVAKGSKLYDWRLEDDEPINYFLDILPRVRRAYPFARRLEFVQHPGDTVFVPAGWWHAVLNLDHSVGVTQNFVSRANFDDAWRKTRDSRPKMVCTWFKRLARSPDHADLAARARALGPGRNRRLRKTMTKVTLKDHRDVVPTHFVSPRGSDDDDAAAAAADGRRHHRGRPREDDDDDNDDAKKRRRSSSPPSPKDRPQKKRGCRKEEDENDDTQK